jgi:hypothetical protein
MSWACFHFAITLSEMKFWWCKFLLKLCVSFSCNNEQQNGFGNDGYQKIQTMSWYISLLYLSLPYIDFKFLLLFQFVYCTLLGLTNKNTRGHFLKSQISISPPCSFQAHHSFRHFLIKKSVLNNPTRLDKQLHPYLIRSNDFWSHSFPRKSPRFSLISLFTIVCNGIGIHW